MATTFKNFTSADIATTRTLLNEAIPITGTIVSGTYSDLNIQNYSHQLFQSVYDYPYLSSSANHIFDITFGYASGSALSGSTSTANSKKLNIYNQFSQILAGYDTGSIVRKFDQDGNYGAGTTINDAFFLSFARLLVKDEIKKGSFQISIGTGSAIASPFAGGPLTIYDASGVTDYRTNSPAGEYGLLYTNSAGTGDVVGHVYYQAGAVVLTASVFPSTTVMSGTATLNATLSGSTIPTIADSLRRRINNITFNNTTELNSTIYFCRAFSNEFNYSSNPTYLSQSKIVVKDEASDPPLAYITTVGLYSADNELLAVAKLSEPLKKTVDSELTIRTRLDY